jgi:hypothetical protein
MMQDIYMGLNLPNRSVTNPEIKIPINDDRYKHVPKALVSRSESLNLFLKMLSKKELVVDSDPSTIPNIPTKVNKNK